MVRPSPATAGLLAAFVAVSSSVPFAVPVLLDGCDRFLGQWFGPIGLLVTRTLRAELGRVMVMSAALFASLVGVLGLAGLLMSLEESLASGLRAALANVDLVVTAGGDRFSDEAVSIDADTVEAIARVPAVAYVDRITVTQIPYQGSLTALVASDATLLLDGRRDVQIVAPDRNRALLELATGEGVLVTNTFARRFGHDIGDAIALATPSGLAVLPIVGRYLFEPSAGDVGAVKMDQGLYWRLFGVRTVTAVHVTLRADAEESGVVRRLQHQIGDRNDLFVATAGDLRDQYHAVLDGLSSLLTPMIAIACLLGSLGLVAGRLATVEGRRRALKMLRAIGATRRQCTTMIVTESLVIGTGVAVVAAIAGSVFGCIVVKVVLLQACGIDVPYIHPTAITASIVLAATALGAASGFTHERVIARLSPEAAAGHG